MQVEEERNEGRCPFPCNLSSLLTLNCRAKAQSLACRLQSQVNYKNSPGTEGTLLVGSDGKVRLANGENRTYSLDDYNLESIHKNDELKKLRPIHVVTSEPTLHLCLPSHHPVREEESPTEQEQDSDVYYDFDLVTPPEDYACTSRSRIKSDETITEENERHEKPESGCVTSVTSPVMFSVDMDLPPSNIPSPLDDTVLQNLNRRASDVDLETVRKLLATSGNKFEETDNNSMDKKFFVRNNRPDFLGVVKSSNFLKTSSGSESSSSSSSESELTSDGGTNIPDDEKELISKEKNVLRNMSFYLPPPSSYQILHNKESDADGSEVTTTPKPKHKTIRPKCKKKKTKCISSSKTESSDSPLQSHYLSSSPDNSVHSVTLREFNKLPRHLIIRSKSVEQISNQSPNKIKTSHSFEKCGCDIYPCSEESSQSFEIKKEIRGKIENITRNIKIGNNKEMKKVISHSNEYKIVRQTDTNSKNTYNALEAKEIQAKLEIEGGFAVSSLNEEEILQEINEAISILKKDSHDSTEQKLAKYEEADGCDKFGIKPNKKDSCSKQVAVTSPDSTSDVVKESQNFVSVSQSCDVCEEVPFILGKPFDTEKCDNFTKNKVKHNSSYDNFPQNLLEEDKIVIDMPRSKGRSKVKKVNSDSHSGTSQETKELPETSFSSDFSPVLSTSENGENSCSKFKEPNNLVSEKQVPSLTCKCNDTDEYNSLNSVENDLSACRESKLNNQNFSNIQENNLENSSYSNLTSENKTFNHDVRTNNCSSTLPVESVDYCNYASCSNTVRGVSLNNCCDRVCSDSEEKIGNLKKINHNNNNLKGNHNSTLVNNFKNENWEELESRASNSDFTTTCQNNCESSCDAVEEVLINERSQNIDSIIVTTTKTDEFDNPYSSIFPDSTSSEMNPNCERDHEETSLENQPDNYSDKEDLNDEIELLSVEEKSEGKEDEEEESDEEILISSRFKNISNYSERITRLSEDDDDGLPPPPTEVILIDYNEPIETSKEEEEEEKQNVTAAALESELNRLSLEEPTVQAPSDESERSSEEREVDLDKQLRIKRSSSLRCGKTPPGTPGRKKIVRFADALGLDLADVRTFLDGVPNVPASAYDDLRVEADIRSSTEPQLQGLPSYGSYTAAASAAAAVLQSQAERILTPMFQQPGALPDFYNRLREQKVVLENVSVGNDLSVKGVVRVINEAFHKKVYIRYTFDHWRNYHEATASYVDGSGDNFSDRFSFLLWGSFLQSNGSLIFCVKYCVNHQEYWDNNRGSNYVLHCYSAPPQIRTLHGKPQNDHSIQHQENQNPSQRHFPTQSGNSGRGGGNFSSFVDSPNTPTDPWVSQFF